MDVTATTRHETPASWRAELSGSEKEHVDVLQLVNEKSGSTPGWCTAAFQLVGPEVEIMCGGINTKRPSHAGIWRQGNLLHFGFEPSPSLLNESGRKLLANCIAYIARFADDRPVSLEPSPLDPSDVRTRYFLSRSLRSEKCTSEELATHFAEPWRSQVADLPLAEAKTWVKLHYGKLRSKERSLIVDEDAMRLGVNLDDEAVFDHLLSQLEHDGKRPYALRLLARLIPAGPGIEAEASTWSEWIETNGSFLFFCEAAGYIWLIDPLAQSRGVPSAQLRGPARGRAAPSPHRATD